MKGRTKRGIRQKRLRTPVKETIDPEKGFVVKHHLAIEPSAPHGHLGGQSDFLLCPICRFDFVTLDMVHLVETNGQYEPQRSVHVTAIGSIMSEPGDVDGVHSGSKGHCFAIDGECEAGHRFRLRFGRHKGRTFVDAVDLGPAFDPLDFNFVPGTR